MTSTALPAVAGVLLACGAPVLHAAVDQNSFGSALVSEKRSTDIKPEEDIYAPLLGVWEVDTLDRQPDGSSVSGRGEWLFSRTLEGRAFQDVWILPSRVSDGERPNHLTTDSARPSG